MHKKKLYMQVVLTIQSYMHESLKQKSPAEQNHVIHVHVPYAYIYCTHLLHVPRIIFNNTPYIRSARTGLIQVYKTRTTFGNPDQIWQPKVVRGRTNFGSEKWSALTTFCPDQFSRDRPGAFRILVDHHRPEAVTTKTYQLLKNTLQRHYQAGICIVA